MKSLFWFGIGAATTTVVVGWLAKEMFDDLCMPVALRALNEMGYEVRPKPA